MGYDEVTSIDYALAELVKAICEPPDEIKGSQVRKDKSFAKKS